MTSVLGLTPKDTQQMIREGKVTICIVGLGFVGLPLAVLFATEGAKVIGCVRTERSALRINSGETSVTEHDVSILLREGASMLEASCPNCGVRLFKFGKEIFCPSCGNLASITEFGVHLQDKVALARENVIRTRQGIKDLLRDSLKSRRFQATTSTTDAVRHSDVVLLTVGTPIDEKKLSDYTDLQNASHNVGQGLQKDTLVVLKSTVAPGTTENLVKPILEAEAKLEAGTDFGLTFMPENIKEGHALHEFRTIPRIVGGITRRCANAAANVFSIFPAPVYTYEKISVVEAAKLFMNIYRDVNIALSNEFALSCEKLGVDVIKAINAANIDPKTHLLTPGLVGGYCLPKDTYHLAYSSEKAGYSPHLITLARQLNDTAPLHIVELTKDAFREMAITPKGARIAVLGLGFKANSGDLRNTPAERIVRQLLDFGTDVIAQDPFADFTEVDRILPQLACTREVGKAVQGARCTVIVTDHLEYRNLTARYLKKLMSSPCAIVDARHIIDPKEAKSAQVIFRGFGKPV